jgi:hypothetical protein
MFGKLPDAYTQHPTYLRLFAGSVRPFFTSAVLYLTSIYRAFLKLAHLLCPEWSIKPSNQWMAGRYEHALLNSAPVTLY